MDTAIQDVKFVFRSVARRPSFTAAVLLTLGLGIGATTAIFSVVNGVLLDPLPFEAADRLVTPNVMSTEGFFISTSIPNYYDRKDQSRSFEAFGAYRGATAVLTGLDRPEVVQTRQVLGDFFEVLGVDAAIGRAVGAGESEPGGPAIATVSHGFWENRLGGDPNVLGHTLTLNDQPFEIVGVMPEGFGFPSPTDDIYLPMGYFSETLSWNTRGNSSGTRAIGRLLPDMSIEQAQIDLTRVTQASRESGEEMAAAPELVSVSDLTGHHPGFPHEPDHGRPHRARLHLCASAGDRPSLRVRSGVAVVESRSGFDAQGGGTCRVLQRAGEAYARRWWCPKSPSLCFFLPAPGYSSRASMSSTRWTRDLTRWTSLP